jgi:CHAT domain
VRHFAEAFAAPEAELLTAGWRAALLPAVADDLYWLYEAHGMTVALEWSLALAERSLADPDLRAEARAIVRNRCFRALAARYEVNGDPADLDAAIRQVEEAVREDDEADEAINNLALALRSRRRPADLDRAIDLIEARLESARRAGPWLLVNHAVLLYSRYILSSASDRRLTDISRAAESAESALQTATVPHHRVKALLISGELAVCQIEAGSTPGPQDPRWAAASASFGDAVRLAAGLGAQSELPAAHSWALAAARLGDWATADGAFGIAIGAFERAEAYRPAGELRDVALPGSYGLPAAAALAKIRLSESLNDSGPLKDAIVILDRYRARQLIFSSIGTADPADPSVAAQIAVIRRRQRIEDELANVCSPLNLPDQFDRSTLSGLSKALTLLADLADASAELAAIRAGQLAASLADGDSLLELFGDRTIVYIASALETGFALIAGPTGTPIRTVLLPDLANDAIVAREEIYSAAPPGARGEVCSWLWDAAIEPLVDRFGRRPEDLWIVPTWVLGTFPLHAAGPPERAPTRDLLEETTVRYLPAGRLLRTGPAPRPVPARLAILAAPTSPDHPAPLLSEAEARAVHDAWSGSPAPLIGSEVTGRALVDAVAHADVLHLSCHGEADPEGPLNSRVYLAGSESMTMADLRQVRTGLTLAVLSACDTGVIGHGDYDEVLGLPAVLLAAGCRGVICALWEVPDLSSALLFARFYQLWPDVHRSPARALRAAQQWLRATCAANIAADFPALYAASPTLPVSRLEQWAGSMPFASPDHWAGFCYVGT